MSCALALVFLPFQASAEAEDPKMQMLFVGADPTANAPGPLPPDLPVIAIQTLPIAEAARQAVFAARLRARPVSTFVTAAGDGDPQFEQFFLVAELGLGNTPESYRISLGGEQFDLEDFAARTAAVVSAFDPKHRRIGFLRIADPEDAFPQAVGEIQAALDSIGFDLMVVMIGEETAASECEAVQPQALHYALTSGLADRPPFGDGDGISTSAEVEHYVRGALNRQVARDPGCGLRYSLLIKSSNDPAQELIAYGKRSPFIQLETQLRRETFEAMFLMQSDEMEAVEEYLAECLYCPNERALSDRLRDMQEYARASSIEADIWNRIRADEAPVRLAIYLENCTLCLYRGQVEDRLEEIGAKTRAASGENAAFEAAMKDADLAALKAYVSGCIACAHKAEAEAEIARLESDAVFQAEESALTGALDSNDIGLLKAYLKTCRICSGKEEVTAALALQTKRNTFIRPCLEMAAVPQLGGPRKLEEIDTAKALDACQAAARAFPADGLIRTTLGRVAQAAGDFETARTSYAFGMNAQVPSAFGLAAYSHYAPPRDEDVDLIAAEVLAVKGAEMGDWLSQEILTVIYSKDLIPGKSPEDAFRIAMNIAEEGNPLAQFFVGYYYLTGTGVGKSEEQAGIWLAKSVEQGYTHAFSFLAELHEKGVGPGASFETAAELYWEALHEGDPTAAERLTTQIRDRNPQVVRIIQERLRDAGAYTGKIDGVPGRGTVAAIRRYTEELT